MFEQFAEFLSTQLPVITENDFLELYFQFFPNKLNIDDFAIYFLQTLPIETESQVWELISAYKGALQWK